MVHNYISLCTSLCSYPSRSSQLPMALIRACGAAGAAGTFVPTLLCLSLAVLALPFCAALEGAEKELKAQKAKVVLQAAGASFPNLVYQDLIFAYQFVAPNVKMSYLSTGSGGGQCRIRVRADAQIKFPAAALTIPTPTHWHWYRMLRQRCCCAPKHVVSRFACRGTGVELSRPAATGLQQTLQQRYQRVESYRLGRLRFPVQGHRLRGLS